MQMCFSIEIGTDKRLLLSSAPTSDGFQSRAVAWMNAASIWQF
jgi:hypothetical protein